MWEATSALTSNEGVEVLLANEGRAVLVEIAVEGGEAGMGMEEEELGEDKGWVAFLPISC